MIRSDFLVLSFLTLLELAILFYISWQGIYTRSLRKELAASKIAGVWRLRQALLKQTQHPGQLDLDAFRRYFTFAAACHLSCVRRHYFREAWRQHGALLQEMQHSGKLLGTSGLQQSLTTVAAPDPRQLGLSQRALLRKAPRLALTAKEVRAQAQLEAVKNGTLTLADLVPQGPGAIPSPAAPAARVLPNSLPSEKEASGALESGQASSLLTAAHAEATASRHLHHLSMASLQPGTKSKALPPIAASTPDALHLHSLGPEAFVPELTNAVVRDLNTVDPAEEQLRQLRQQLDAQQKEIKALKQQKLLLEDINR